MVALGPRKACVHFLAHIHQLCDPGQVAERLGPGVLHLWNGGRGSHTLGCWSRGAARPLARPSLQADAERVWPGKSPTCAGGRLDLLCHLKACEDKTGLCVTQCPAEPKAFYKWTLSPF